MLKGFGVQLKKGEIVNKSQKIKLGFMIHILLGLQYYDKATT
jgi:hypothetical protein